MPPARLERATLCLEVCLCLITPSILFITQSLQNSIDCWGFLDFLDALDTFRYILVSLSML